jgi:glycosyltransferase involved in cell wall biosynthesis
MVVIHLSSSLGIGGAAMMILELTKQSDGIIRTVVFSISSNNSLEEKFKDSNIEYYFLNITSFKNKSLLKGLKKLNIIIKNLDDNAIFHCHQFHGFILGFLYNLFYSNKPIVFTLHTTNVKDIKRKILLYITKPFRKIDIIFSKNTKQWYLKNNAIIPNGVDFKELENEFERSYSKLKEFSFLYLGRLSQEKNPLFMISAALQLKERNVKNFIFDVVGDGKLMEELKQLISKHKLSKYFNLLGFQKNIKKYLIKSHCLIIPSQREGMPVVLIEAAAVKLPIIATPVGSIPDIINSENGYLCPIDNFVETMVNVISNYKTALEKAEQLYLDTKNVFDIRQVYQEHVKLYKSI